MKKRFYSGDTSNHSTRTSRTSESSESSETGRTQDWSQHFLDIESRSAASFPWLLEQEEEFFQNPEIEK